MYRAVDLSSRSRDSSPDLFPLCLEAVLVQADVHQLVLDAPKQEDVRRCQVRTVI
jgi:hypothetical protein